MGIKTSTLSVNRQCVVAEVEACELPEARSPVASAAGQSVESSPTTKDEYVLQQYDYPSTPWRDASELAHLRDSFFPEKMVLESLLYTSSRLSFHRLLSKYGATKKVILRLVPHAMSATAMLSESPCVR